MSKMPKLNPSVFIIFKLNKVKFNFKSSTLYYDFLFSASPNKVAILKVINFWLMSNHRHNFKVYNSLYINQPFTAFSRITF